MILTLILVLTVILRFTNLSNLPPGLYLDEVLYGLDAYSLINTGKDIYGYFLPLAFQSSGYYPPLFTYLLAPFFLFLPLEPWVIRLPAALFGTLTVLLTYFLARELFKDSTIATTAALLLAISPWHVHISRVAFLGSFGVVFLVLGIYLFLRHHPVLSLIVFSLSTHVHYGYKFLAPVLFAILIFLYRHRLNLFAYPIILVTLLSHLISIRYYNAMFRVTELSLVSLPEFFHQYLSAFSPQFLFLTGDHNLLLNPWSRGQLPLVFAPLITVGLFSLIKLSKQRWLLIFWLLLTPVPSALAGLGSHAVRVSPLLIPLTLIAALGLTTWHHWSKYILVTALFIEIIVRFRFYAQSYPLKSFYLWGNPERQIINRAINSSPSIIIQDAFNVRFSYYAFMTKLPPATIQSVINQSVKQFNQIQFVDALRL